MPHTRRGYALLLVLAAILMISAVCVPLATTRAELLARHATEVDAKTARELANAAESAVETWLLRASGLAVCPPEASAPVFAVLDDEWAVDGERFRVTITAFDQAGMAPPAAITALRRSGWPLDLDEERVIADVTADRLGLDALEAAAFRAESISVYPPPGNLSADQPAPLGARIATHNPPPGRESRPPLLNLNTAPAPLLRAALRATGRSGAEQVLAARTEGLAAGVPGTSSPNGGGPIARLSLVGASPVWSFRIDAYCNSIRRSYWVVYVLSGDEWVRVQRLAIPR